MPDSVITIKSGKISEYLHHVDLKEFGVSRVLSCFIAEFDEGILIFDTGSSLEVKRLLRYMRRNNLSKSSVKYLVTTHHHFDHCGGIWKLYESIKAENSDVKIITNSKTKELLNDYNYHLNRAKRTFGTFVGEMNPIEDDAFILIQPDSDYEKGMNAIHIIESFSMGNSNYDFALLKTPGHTPDHQCPLFMRNNEIDFIFFGEAVGTLYHSSELLTMPTSMPVYFNYSEYMNSLKKLKHLEFNNAGFCHFGVVRGKQNVKSILDEHEQFMVEFRQKVIKAYKEKPETRHVFDQILPYFIPRTDLVGEEHPVMKNIVLGVVYGMLMDLGYRDD